MTFQKSTVFITGGASGIGRHTAMSFAAQGARVAVADWNYTGAQETAHLIVQAGGQAWPYQLDVSQYTLVQSTIQQVITHLGSIDIAINNAGVGGDTPSKTAEHTLEDWDKVIGINQSGVFYCMKEELKYMSQAKKGVIVNVSSIAGLRGLPRQAAYVASKHAVIGLTKTAALEYARESIRINAVCPVFTNSPLLEGLFAMKEDLRAKLIHTIPVGRYGETQDIVNAIEWLCDPKSSFVTGLCLPIDGGQTA